jgi:hypothetical protein
VWDCPTAKKAGSSVKHSIETLRGMRFTAAAALTAWCAFANLVWAEDGLKSLQCGVPLIRELESGSSDSFRIEQPGDRVLVEAIDISGDLGLLKLSLADMPDVATCSGTLPLDRPVGDVVVADCIANPGQDLSGEYAITMAVVSETAGNCGTPLPCDQPVSARLAVRGQVDSYVFPVSGDGSQVQLALGNTPASAQTFRMRVFDPQGGPVDGSDSCDGVISLRPTEPGLYTVLVSACARPVAGPYVVAWKPTSCPVVAGCPGDCSGDGRVTVDELVTGVNIALGELDPAECSPLDVNSDGKISVDELVAAVNSALHGCTAGAPTAAQTL